MSAHARVSGDPGADKWHVRLDEIAPDLSHKNLLIAFEKAEDRTAFKNAFAKSNATQARLQAEAQAKAEAERNAGQDTVAA